MYLYKLIFTTTLFVSTFMAVSSYTWLGAWMGLEINLLSFIPLMKDKNNSYASESSMKYFLIQAFASSLFFMSIILIMFMNNLISELILIKQTLMIILNSSILLKMGAAPFHFWFPEIIDGLNWINSLILMTWQKIAPMMLLSYSIKTSSFISFIIISCSLIGSIMGLNQTSIRKLLAYSSINHMGWMICSFMKNEMIWIIYFMIYSIISMTLISMLNSYKIFFLKQFYNSMNMNILIKFSIMINLLSLGGLPPFLGFLPKWMVIQFLSLNFKFILMIMIMSTLITLFFYLRIAYSSLLINHNQLNFYQINIHSMSPINFLLTFISISGLIFCTWMMNM
uniref:NADH-ubiquinone oxidoreductase chain 2 n=1 Tax=Pogonostoma subtiligrossum TaxID=1343354 RepID=A0A343EYZ9_9CARA|nr:NADH dehydrogenase subunit 2 [Pogonostoma subtiligrossum]